MKVKTLNKKKEFEEWDKLVDSSSQGTIFQKSYWIKTHSEIIKKTAKIYSVFDDDRLIGGCNLYLKKTGMKKTASSICIMSPYGGFIFEKMDTKSRRKKENYHSKIINLIIDKLKEEKLNFIQIVNSPFFDDVRPFIWNNWKSEVRHTYIFRINENYEEVFSKGIRREIKNAGKNNIKISKEFDLNVFNKLFEDTYEKQGIKKPVSNDFIKKVVGVIKENNSGEMWIAKTDTGEPVSAEIIIYDEKMPYRWNAVSNSEYLKTGGISYLLTEIIKSLKDRNYSSFNMMAANTPNLSSYVAKFNPVLFPYYRVFRLDMKYRLLNILGIK